MRRSVVIGAGVVGLACGAALARRGDEVFVLEAERLIGSGVSSRNSEVIHGGMYYPDASLKAFHCVRGRRMLYPYLESRGVAYRKCGKLIVATSEDERAKIETIAAQGEKNGVEGLSLLSGPEARALEPALACVGAIRSTETGIVDSHGLMLALQGDIETAGGWVVLGAPVEAVRRSGGSWIVRTGGAEPFETECDVVVNAAGLGAWDVARATEAFPEARVPPRVLAKGSYFGFQGKSAFSRLIYPAPVDGGLGVHVTLDLAGRMRFGPDVEWVEREEYGVDPSRARAFYAAVRRYWPDLPDDSLVPDYSGIRPKICGPGGVGDFVLDTPDAHGVDGLVQLFGIESPGLTSCLSIAEAVAAGLDGRIAAAA